ncbi:MAG: coenzyme A pyrophosphatase [Ignavibacteria bacterium RBG_16_34_14]|nr:MAG: coenzyme A pyrophosphatase [Ignavibacteria bacterium RBG_16_34_14]
MKEIDFNLLKEKLPKYPELIDKEEYFNSSVLIPFVKINNDYHLLFEKRAANIRQGGEVSFPGGEFDKEIDKTLLETAIRETIEELGIEKEKINIIGQLGILMIPGVVVNAFIAEVEIGNPAKINFDETEVEKIFTVPVSFFKENPPQTYHINLEAHPFYIDEEGKKIDLLPVEQLKLPPRYSKPWGRFKRKVYVYNFNGEVIWGITAALVKRVVELI